MGRIDRYLLSQLMAVFGLAALVLVLVYWINRAVVLFDQLIAELLAGGQGLPPDEYPAWSSLLLGPTLRGTVVTVQ